MSGQDKQKAFDKSVKQEAKQLSKIQTQTRDEIAVLLKQAYADAVEILKNQPTDYQQWYYPQVKNNIEQALADLGAATGAVATAGQETAWAAGQALVDKPFAAAGVAIKAMLPAINPSQLLAMQSFMTGKMKDVSAEALTKINTQLGLTIIGSQGVEDTIKGIQDAHTMSRKRATTIVRTELGRAYATASQLRMEQSAERLPNLKKQWRRSGKIHSRRSHDFTDGQIRPVNKPFIIGTGAVVEGHEGGGPRLMYPHDPKAPASETVNCGCMSTPYMDAWKDAGVLKDPGKRAFTDQEIALNPTKADYAAAMDNFVPLAEQLKPVVKQPVIKQPVLAIAKAEKAGLDRINANLDANLAAFQLQEALAGELGKWHKSAAQKLAQYKGKNLDELAAELKAQAQQKAAITAYKKAVLAGKKTSKIQETAFAQLPVADQQALKAELDGILVKQATSASLYKASARTEATVDRLAVQDAAGWQQIGPQAGSNPGGVFTDASGAKWYVKFPADTAQAHNEVLAGKLYHLVGVDAPELALVRREGKIGVASRMIDGLASDAHALTTGGITGIAEGFGADAWLANWDVVGLGYDNLLIKNGRAWRVDTGGALAFRAQGGLKGAAFGDIVSELQTLRDVKINPQAAAVFGHLTEPQIKASVARVLATNDDAIRRTVMQFSGGTLAERSALADKLMARKAFLAKLYPDVMPKIAEARQLAVEQARSEVRSVLNGLDDDILAAIKGIASRAKSGAALDVKDIARVSAAASRYRTLLESGGDALFDTSLEAVKAHYGPWLDRLQAAIDAGVGSKASWEATELFAGLKSTAVEVNPAKVKPAFAPFLFGDAPLFSAKAVKQTLIDVQQHLGKSDFFDQG